MSGIKLLNRFNLVHLRRRWTQSLTSPLLYSTAPRNLTEENTNLEAFDLNSYMLQKTNSINKALEASVPLRESFKLHEAMRYSLLSPGKRVCPIVCIACCELVGGDESIAMPTACAHEMIHAMCMMYDDLPCMDNADLRRGKPSSHSVYDEGITLLAAASLLTLAFEHIAVATKGVPPERILRVVGELGRLIGAQGAAAGQVADLSMAAKEYVKLEELEYVHIHKTGDFLAASAISGAILGGASEEEIDKIRKFSSRAGLFQVIDDVLDVTKSEIEVGKRVGMDMEGGKMTYPRLIGVDKSMEFARKLSEEAKAHLVGFDPVQAAPLIAMADYIVKRQK